ncbi:MAG: Lrp/AsnC family transcriptional regulator [Thermoprotei archaeon]|nr:MAG: Lrp/AsnC family transcriptional regulator [Thermoprotei archaeon]
MAIAYVLISTEIGAEKDVLEKLREIPEIKEAYVVYGVYDVVAKVMVDSVDGLREIITSKIRKLNRVRSTLTMIVVEGFQK